MPEAIMPQGQPMMPSQGAMPQGNPMMPAGVPNVPQGEPMMPEGEEVTPAMRAELEREFNKVKQRKDLLDIKKEKSEAKLSKKKEEVIQQVFDMMKDQGVDPDSLESIQRFLRELERKDPDLLVLFEKALDGFESTMTDMQGTEDAVLPEEELNGVPPMGGMPMEGMPGLGQAAEELGEGAEEMGGMAPVMESPDTEGDGLTNQYQGIKDTMMRQ